MHPPGVRIWRDSAVPAPRIVDNAAPRSLAGPHVSAVPRSSLPGRRTVLAVAIVLVALAALAIAAVTLPGAIRRGRSALEAQINPPARPGRSLSSGTLLYTVFGDEQAAVFGVGGTPRGVQAVIDAGGESAGAVASPDGTQVVYLHAPCPRCAASYEVRNLIGGVTRVIGSVPPPVSLNSLRTDVTWSSDSRRLAFTEAGLDSAEPRIFMLDNATGERRPLSMNDATRQGSPVWSPDGRTVAYLGGGDQTIVSVVDVETGEFRPLNDQLDHAADLAWSPDGRFLSIRRDGGLWLIDAGDGHGYPVATPGPVMAIGGWAPGSRSLVVTTTDRAIQGPASPMSVYVAPIDGAAPIRLVTGAQLGSPLWSSDGRQIAWSDVDDDRWTLWSAASTGGAARQLAAGTGTVRLDTWR